MLLFGRIIDIVALTSAVLSAIIYLLAGSKSGAARERLSRVGRWLYALSTAAVISAFADLGTMLVQHRFDSDYVYNHSAKASAPLYWFPSLWAGQEGSFLLWAFWTGILGVVLSMTARKAERRVMPIYNLVTIFLTTMLVIRSPFLPLDTHGMPVPTEGLGLNPNLENPWMVIHPPTLFLGLSALAAPFAYGLSALIWKDWDNWLRRALPWGLFGFALLGLAMMMGGYWAYEMLGWGGFWGWDPVENGPLIPWLGVVAFLHSAQVQKVRKGLAGTTLAFAMLPFVLGLYETFLTRTGILEKFSVHSFSTLGGIGNDIILYVLIGSFLAVVVGLIWRRRDISGDGGSDGSGGSRKKPAPDGPTGGGSVWDTPGSKEFGYLMAIVLVTLCGLISTVGMSWPLLSQIGVNMHLMKHVASVKEDFYNQATYPIAVLVAIGMGLAPYLTWRKWEPDSQKLVKFYATSVIAAIIFTLVGRWLGTAVFGKYLAAQLLLFAASTFALTSNGYLLIGKLRRRGDETSALVSTRAVTAGGVISHLGVAIFLIGVVCLVTFVRRDSDVMFQQGKPEKVLSGAYTMTYLGQTSDYKKDRDNALKFSVVSKDEREKFTAILPFAQRTMEGGQPMIFSHPGIAHHFGSDLYLALKDGPDEVFRSPRIKFPIGMGKVRKVGPYTIQLVRFDRRIEDARYIAATGQTPPIFPITAVINVTYQSKVTTVTPQFVMHTEHPEDNESPEVKLPDGWLITFEGMNAGSADMNGGSQPEDASFTMRADTGPPVEAFELDITTRPMVDLVWVGTMLMVIGGLVSMRRRIVENRNATDPDIDDAPASTVSSNGNGRNGHAKNGTGDSKARKTTVGVK